MTPNARRTSNVVDSSWRLVLAFCYLERYAMEVRAAENPTGSAFLSQKITFGLSFINGPTKFTYIWDRWVKVAEKES